MKDLRDVLSDVVAVQEGVADFDVDVDVWEGLQLGVSKRLRRIMDKKSLPQNILFGMYNLAGFM